jgi:SPP1 gp7 family putative phage head morphogenesis protein
LRTLPPQYLRDRDFEPIESEIVSFLRLAVFDRLLSIIQQELWKPSDLSLQNANENLVARALASGRIQYAGGVFSGRPSAAISTGLRSAGAKFNKTRKAYTLDEKDAPSWLLAAASDFQARSQRAHDRIIEQLGKIQDNLAIEIGGAINADKVVDSVERGWRNSARSLEVMPELSGKAREQMATTLSDNVELSVKGFTNEMVDEMREAVDKNAREGCRFDTLTDIIQMRYGLSERRAKFLARQETGLFMAEFRRRMFEDVGLRHYIWDSSRDARVRPDHRRLDGKMFAYSDPPIIDLASGRRGNPGQDFNCRCVDRPVVEADFREYQKKLHVLV